MEERHEEEVQQSGVRGGSAAAYVPGTYTRTTERVTTFGDRIRWAPVWAGLVVAFAGQIWLTAIGVAIFARAGAAGSGLGVWTGITGLIALSIGGLIASKLSAAEGSANGIWHGVVLWGLAFTLLTILGSIGIGGAYSAFFTGAKAASAPGISTMGITNGAWLFVVFQLLSLIAAAAGGAAGARPVVEEINNP